MIFFCEDCGEKNDLEKENLHQGKVLFRCSSCQYSNSYAVFSTLESTDLLLKKIQSDPDIIGCFLYHERTSALINHMPGVLKENDLENMGHYLAQSYLAAVSRYPDIRNLTITISDKHITILTIEPHLFLFVVSNSLPLPKAVQVLLISACKRG